MIDKQRETNAFQRVFGKEDDRTEDQQIVWSYVMSYILQKSTVEEKTNKTARDLALDILEKVTYRPKDK